MFQNDIDTAGTDYVHSGSRFVFHEYGFTGVISANVDDAFEDLQFLRREIAKEWNVLKNFGQRLIVLAQSKNISPDTIRPHRKANASTR